MHHLSLFTATVSCFLWVGEVLITKLINLTSMKSLYFFHLIQVEQIYETIEDSLLHSRHKNCYRDHVVLGKFPVENSEDKDNGVNL